MACQFYLSKSTPGGLEGGVKCHDVAEVLTPLPNTSSVSKQLLSVQGRQRLMPTVCTGAVQAQVRTGIPRKEEPLPGL